ncbi:MAG: AGE family epimerase/isomerase [Pseudomonadota bacterium]|nr:AGE family epimerase/isomerase [Pseudomonadota bacterium]
MRHFLDFEKPIAALEGKVEELRHMSSDGSINIADEIGKLQTRIERELKTTYERLGPWEKVQVARHPDRPRVSAIIDQLFDDFTPLAGDRNYAEDYAVIGGMARFRGQAVMVMGTEKGRTTEERIKRNFGMARPEGYRKAARLMDLAGRFGLPVLSFVDTAGAYPGRGAEERGQAEAIATAWRLYDRTGKDGYRTDYHRLWDWSWDHLVDHKHGAWYRITSREGDWIEPFKSPAGKTDYHTMGACWDVLSVMRSSNGVAGTRS